MPDIRSQLVDALLRSAGNIGNAQEAADSEAILDALVKLGGFENKEAMASIQGNARNAADASKRGDAIALQNAKYEMQKAGDELKREFKRFEIDKGLEKQDKAIAGEVQKLTTRNIEERKGAAQAAIIEAQKPVMGAKAERQADAIRQRGIVELVKQAQSGDLTTSRLALQSLAEKGSLPAVADLIQSEAATLGTWGKQRVVELVKGGSTLTPDKIIEIAKNEQDVRTYTPVIEKLSEKHGSKIGSVARLEEAAKAGRAAQYAAEVQEGAALAARKGAAKKGLIGAGAAILLPLLAMSMFGKGKKGEGESEIPPMLQLQMAAQAQRAQQGEDQADGRALLNLQRAMNIIKTLQGFSGLQGGQAPATAGLL